MSSSSSGVREHGLSSIQTLGSDPRRPDAPHTGRERFIDLARRDGLRAAVAERDGRAGDYSQAVARDQPNPRPRDPRRRTGFDEEMSDAGELLVPVDGASSVTGPSAGSVARSWRCSPAANARRNLRRRRRRRPGASRPDVARNVRARRLRRPRSAPSRAGSRISSAVLGAATRWSRTPASSTRSIAPRRFPEDAWRKDVETKSLGSSTSCRRVRRARQVRRRPHRGDLLGVGGDRLAPPGRVHRGEGGARRHVGGRSRRSGAARHPLQRRDAGNDRDGEGEALPKRWPSSCATPSAAALRRSVRSSRGRRFLSRRRRRTSPGHSAPSTVDTGSRRRDSTSADQRIACYGRGVKLGVVMPYWLDRPLLEAVAIGETPPIGSERVALDRRDDDLRRVLPRRRARAGDGAHPRSSSDRCRSAPRPGALALAWRR